MNLIYLCKSVMLHTHYIVILFKCFNLKQFILKHSSLKQQTSLPKFTSPRNPLIYRKGNQQQEYEKDSKKMHTGTILHL